MGTCIAVYLFGISLVAYSGYLDVGLDGKALTQLIPEYVALLVPSALPLVACVIHRRTVYVLLLSLALVGSPVALFLLLGARVDVVAADILGIVLGTRNARASVWLTSS